MVSTHWIVEGKIDPRWPLNTRANIGEVFPEVLTPMTYGLAVRQAEMGWRDSYRKLGSLRETDITSTEPVIIGLYAGYGYLNVSYLRIAGVRAPGSSPEAIDATLFGEGNPPPYEPKPGDKSLIASLKILINVMKALGVKSEPPEVEQSRRIAQEIESAQPSLDAPDELLWSYFAEKFPERFREAFMLHILVSSYASIISGMLADGAAKAGNPGLATQLTGAAGGVVSASYSQDLYEVAKHVRASAELMRVFDEGTAGLMSRLSNSGDALVFRERFAAFLAKHGHRGPNDWEISSRNWENTPELALVAIDRMRLAEHDLSPASRLANDESARADAAAQVLPHLGFLDKANFRKALVSSPIWTRAREATRDRAIRSIVGAKRAYRELVRRGAERGGVDHPTKMAMLDPHTELLPYLRDPKKFVPLIEERWALRERFAAVTPPFFIDSQEAVPGIEELEARQAKIVALKPASKGDVLKGDPGSAGVARGRARVVLDPGDARGLLPGEVLVAPLTDPAWTPLFLPACAVVVNVGALMSHAVIVSRELGIPCVIALQGATERIRDGMMVEVNGVAGTVTILEGST